MGGLWGNSKEIFDAIEKLSDYATEEIHNAAFMNWNSEEKLLSYTVGRFMRAGTPVPEGLDYYDIPFSFMGKGWTSGEFADMICDAPKLTEEAINKQDKYAIAWSESFVGAEVYTKDTIPKDGTHSVFGYYIPCKEKDRDL